MQWQLILILVIAVLVGLFPVAFIWYICIGGICSAILQRRREKQLEKTFPNLTCSIDTDCPPGFICVKGRCVSQKA
ncbi:MAG: hypothetical protein P8105_03005 [Dehalococcoidia bacterium]|jgi:hypothetical protein